MIISLIASFQNVIVVHQPASTSVVRIQEAPPDFLTLTLVSIALCCFCGGLVGVVLVIPAVICSLSVSNLKSQTSKKVPGHPSVLCTLIGAIYIQELIEPAKPAREHVTTTYTAKFKHATKYSNS